MLRIIQSVASLVRLREAAAFLDQFPPATEVLIVAASRGAADDCARAAAVRRGATFGHHRFSFTQLAARLAAPALARRDLIPGTMVGSEAVAARATFEACKDRGIAYFAPVSGTPGFPRALAKTLLEVRLAGVKSRALGDVALGGPDLAQLLERFEEQFEAASAADRAVLFRAAAGELRAGPTPWSGHPALLLDLPIESAVESDFVATLIAASSSTLATVPAGDGRTLEALQRIEPQRVETLAEDEGSSDLRSLRRYLFEAERPETRALADELRCFSAPGEGRECIEIARRILDEARGGIPFDAMAILLRAPQSYVGLLEHALRRAGIPAWFDRGTRRPDPAGRAFLALLTCAIERLSARRFAEYLSLGQVPQLTGTEPDSGFRPSTPRHAQGRPEQGRGTTASERAELVDARIPDSDGHPTLGDETLQALARVEPQPEPEDEPRAVAAGEAEAAAQPGAGSAVVAGALRAPWKWEELLVESAVIGGQERWRRRLDGLAAHYRLKIRELRRTEGGAPRIDRLERDLVNLAHLRGFALPIIDILASWPERASWGQWLSRFEALAPRVLRYPARVLRVFGELRPMSEIGPAMLQEVRDVLADRLLTLEIDPPVRRFGRVFVGSPHQARGRSFKVVFIPGLAERMFPQKLREDPILLDEVRKELDRKTEARGQRLEAGELHAGTESPGNEEFFPVPSLQPLVPLALVTQDDRTAHERLLLRLAVGCATDRVYVSYPRIDLAESRPRVPSFYLLDIMRAATGVIPNHDDLERAAAAGSGAALDWPAPPDPSRAIDDLEHDLAVLRPLLHLGDRTQARGHAHYLLLLNECLRRAVVARWLRARQQWTVADGMTRVADGVRAALQQNRLAARPYSVSALQRFATCPYQFLLGAIHRLAPVERPEPLQRMDPLTRGSFFHRVQTDFLRSLDAKGALPVTHDGLNLAGEALDEVIARVADEYREELAPAIERVWRDEIDAIATDLRIWLTRMADEVDWVPQRFEFAFGLDDAGRDPRSVHEPVTIDGRFVLRGSVDLVERRRGRVGLRVVDHKTGKDRSTPALVVGGGTILQPVIYGLAVEAAMGERVESGRLYYCTTAGGFRVHDIVLSDSHRHAGLVTLEIIDRAVELGFLPAAPAEHACDWCDFRLVCGPNEEKRVSQKEAEKLGDLVYVRKQP